MRFNIIKEITIKELKSQFDHLSGYVLITLFLGLLYYFFLKTFFVSGVASMKDLFELLPWYLTILVPAVTMGTFAGEFDKQTFEYLESKPIKQLELVLGKIFGATKIIYIAILLTLPLPFFINRIAPIDIGETISGYVAAFVLILALCSMGVAVSTFYKNQIVAFLTTAVLILVLIIINSDITSINVPTNIANSLAQFSIVDNYDPIVRGVLNVSNLVYFIIFIIASIAVAYTNIQKIRISSALSLYKKAFAVVIAVAFVGMTMAYLADYFGDQLGRIDLTSSKKYTLSKVTNDLLNKEGKIKVEVYASPNLPQKYQVTSKEVKNILADYKSAAKGKFEVKYLDPKKNGERLSSMDIQQIQFNTVGEDQFQVQQGYFALAVMNEDESKKEKIDNIQSPDDLEYQLTSLINKIKQTSKPAVGIAAGNDEKNLFADYTYLQQMLAADYDLKSVYFKSAADEANEAGKKPTPTPTGAPDTNNLNLKQYNLLIIPGPKKPYSQSAIKQIKDYVDNGGNVLYLADTTSIDNQTGAVTVNEDPSGKLFENYGVTVNKDMAYDQKNALQIPLQQGLNVAYPYFVISQKDQKADESITFMPNNIILPWAATLNLDSNWKWLYATSDYGGKTESNFVLDPQKITLPNDNLGRKPLIALRKLDGSGGTIVVVGTSKLFDDQFISQVQQNAVFALSVFEALGKGAGFSQIKIKNLAGSQFAYVENNVKDMLNYGAPLSSAILLALIGASRIYRKKKLAQVYADV